ncbi:hypothetical protein HAX54_025114, partial [Datura stramonium]|nr:hypothetical protein [Datura stramonium]
YIRKVMAMAVDCYCHAPPWGPTRPPCCLVICDSTEGILYNYMTGKAARPHTTGSTDHREINVYNLQASMSNDRNDRDRAPTYPYCTIRERELHLWKSGSGRQELMTL